MAYVDTERNVCSSSEDPNNPTTPKWWNRGPNYPEDPLRTTIDYSLSAGTEKVLYIEDNDASPSISILAKGGIYVFIRNAGDLDSIGCG